MTIESTNGSKFRRAWNCRRSQRIPIASASRQSQVTGPEDLDGMIVNAEIVEFPEDGEHAVGPRH